MANLTETAEYTAGIYQYEETDPVQGGINGIDNLPNRQLANRTAYLKQQSDALNAKTQAASETNLGITRFATNSEAVNGQGGDVAIKPYQLFRIIDANVQNLNTSIAQKTTHLSATDALPTSNVGPIWHDLYNGWMIWQEFNQNGANYAGYASVDIGQIFAGTQATARVGYVSFGMTIPIASHPALYHRAKHLGQLKTPAQWQPNTIAYRDNADGSFTVPDLRGMHQRFMGGTGDGINQSREFGSYEADGVKSHLHKIHAYRHLVGNSIDDALKTTGIGFPNIGNQEAYVNDLSTVYAGINENRVKNTAFWGEIKL